MTDVITNKTENDNENNKIGEEAKKSFVFSVYSKIFTPATMRLFIIAVFSFIFAVFTVRGAKLTNTTSVDSAKFKTGGQTILCNHYAGENPKASEAFKKLDEKLEGILKLLQRGEPPSNPG